MNHTVTLGLGDYQDAHLLLPQGATVQAVGAAHFSTAYESKIPDSQLFEWCAAVVLQFLGGAGAPR